MLIYENEKEISSIKIGGTIFNKINLGTGGVIVTAKGQNVDFVSRFFTPQATILEDPVTGSSHCTNSVLVRFSFKKTIISSTDF